MQPPSLAAKLMSLVDRIVDGIPEGIDHYGLIYIP